MVGLAGEGELHARLAGDGVDDAERMVFALEHGALLDVELEVAEGVASMRAAGSSSGSRPKVRMASATVMPSRSVRARVSASSSPMRARLPRNGMPKRTPSSSEKPMTSMAKGRGVGCEFFDDGDAEDDAEEAVEGAGVGDGVEVRADEQARRVGREAGQRPRRLPAASTWTAMPAARIQLAEEGVDVVHGGREEGAGGFAGDLGAGASSRQRAMMRSARVGRLASALQE